MNGSAVVCTVTFLFVIVVNCRSWWVWVWVWVCAHVVSELYELVGKCSCGEHLICLCLFDRVLYLFAWAVVLA